MALIFWLVPIIAVVFLLSGFRMIPQTSRGVIERWGKFNRFLQPGLAYAIPIMERIKTVNITEQIVDVGEQEVITKDRLSAKTGLQVYHRVKSDEESVKSSLYNVFDADFQITQLAKTTMRNVIGNMDLLDANSQRQVINDALRSTMQAEIEKWGYEVVRVEIKQIEPPQSIQEAMNNVVLAQNQKVAAVDFATAVETQADGQRRAQIKQAEGARQSAILQAEGVRQTSILEAEGQAKATVMNAEAQATAIQLENEAYQKYFGERSQVFKQLDTMAESFRNNAKIIVPAGQNVVNWISDMAGNIPVPQISTTKLKDFK